MLVSPRILRAEALCLACHPRELTSREIARQERILDTATELLARHGMRAVTFGALALALRLAPATLRFHFVDLDDLLGEILRGHLQRLAELLGDVPAEPEATLHTRRRAAWAQATRAGLGGTTPAHTLLLRDRHGLPADLLENIEATYRNLGLLLAGPDLPEALTLLDDPAIAPARAEILIAALLAAPALRPEASPDAVPPAPLHPGRKPRRNPGAARAAPDFPAAMHAARLPAQAASRAGRLAAPDMRHARPP